MFTRRKFQITMGLTLVLAVLISVTAASAQEAALGGNVTVRDGAGSAVGSNNSVVIALTGVPSAGAGMTYEGWLISSSGDKVSVGTFNGPSIAATWVSPTNENLAAKYGQFALSLELTPDPDPATPGAITYSGTITIGVLTPFLDLLSSSSATATGNGVATALRGQTAVMVAHSNLADGSDTLGEKQTHVQHVINAVDGLGDPGDDVGVLAYADEAKTLAAQAKAGDPTNAAVTAAADALITAADRTIDRANLTKSNANSVIGASSDNLIVQVALANVVGLSAQASDSAKDTYLAAQDLGAFVLEAGAGVAPPSAGDELVPMLALIVLVAGMVFTGGGVAMLRRRSAA